MKSGLFGTMRAFENLQYLFFSNSSDRLDLESKLQMLQKDLDFKASIMQADKDKSDEKLRLLEKQRDDIYRENNRLKTLINETENISSLLEREQEKNHELTKKIHKLETELATNSNLDHELTEMNLKLKNDLTYYVQDSQKAKEHLQRVSFVRLIQDLDPSISSDFKLTTIQKRKLVQS
jgi:hypothetical protein